MEDSSSSDDSDLEDILFDDEQLMLMFSAKKLQDKKMTKRPGSKIGWFCIPENRALGHSMLMQYFPEVPTCGDPAYHCMCSMQVVDITPMKHRLTSITSIRVVQ
jgi:hypothetical protein